MEKKKNVTNDIILQQLVEKLHRMSAPIVFKSIEKLDRNRQHAIIDMLTPEQFKELTVYCSQYEEHTYLSLWSSNENRKRIHLDALSPKLILSIASQGSAGNQWGHWSGKNKPEDKLLCRNMSDYLCGSSIGRITKFISFIIKSTEGVTAPASERDRDCFVWKKAEQFPWETTRIFSVICPQKLFPALNQISIEFFKKILWLSKKTLSDESTMMEIFADLYGKNYHDDDDVINPIVNEISALEDQKLFLLLKTFSSNHQVIIAEALGEKRIREMNKNKFFSESISIPASFKIFVDKNPNELVLEKLNHGKTIVKRLSSQKTVELLGQLQL